MELKESDSVKESMRQFTMDKDDRKHLIWFLIGLAIAILPWVLLAW